MAKIITDEKKVEELFGRYIQILFPSKEKARELLMSGKKLSFYHGVDPTGPDIHLGHTTNYFVLKKLIELGHKIFLLIGDFTAQTGDPTDKDSTRKPLTEKEVEENMKNYINQVQKILPKGSFEVKYNSSWLKKMNLGELRKLARLVTVQQTISREMFQKRIEEGKQITIEEFLYPLMQGYDSVALKIDGEVGGNDQLFNMMVGRDLVKSLLNKEKVVITTRLLEDPETGKKIMSKSEGHYISLNDSPKEMFGKTMAISDSMILPLFNYATELSDSAVGGIKKRLDAGENPKLLKEELAFELIRMYHGEKEAQKAKEEFEKVFSEGGLPQDIEELVLDSTNITLLDLLEKSGLVSSKSEAKRLVQEGGVQIDGVKKENWNQSLILEGGEVLKVGPRRFKKIVVR